MFAISSVPFNGSVTDAGGPSQNASIPWNFNYDGSNCSPTVSGILGWIGAGGRFLHGRRADADAGRRLWLRRAEAAPL